MNDIVGQAIPTSRRLARRRFLSVLLALTVAGIVTFVSLAKMPTAFAAVVPGDGGCATGETWTYTSGSYTMTNIDCHSFSGDQWVVWASTSMNSQVYNLYIWIEGDEYCPPFNSSYQQRMHVESAPNTWVSAIGTPTSPAATILGLQYPYCSTHGYKTYSLHQFHPNNWWEAAQGADHSVFF